LLAAISCLGGLAAAASFGPKKHAPSVQVQPARARAELALSFEPGPDPTGRAIAKAQDAVRRSPDELAPYVALATEFVRRRRETNDLGLQIYAEDALRAAKDLDADDPKVLRIETMLLQDQHRFAAARDSARRLIALQPEETSGHVLLGDALLELGDYDAAEKAFQHALDIRPDLMSYERGAHLRWLHGDVVGAIQLYGLALDAGSARDPESSAWCHVEVGQIHWHRGDSASALASAKRALALVVDYAPALLLQGRALAQSGETKEAIRILSSVAQRTPTVEVLLELAELLDGPQASPKLEEARRRATTEPLAMALWLARRKQQPEKALALAEQELSARKNVAAHDGYALALLRAGRVHEAKRSIAKALALGTPDARFQLHEGLILAATGDRAAAKQRLARALALNPKVDPRLVDELREATR
jgi:tetratricopeptide (TPR) repeat protein